MGQMCGSFSAAMARASCSKRRRDSESAASASLSTLIATVRSSRVSRARYTSPIPPAPSGAAISYGPSLLPAASVMSRLSLHFGGPVQNDRQGRRVGFVESCIDQKLLAIGGHVVGKQVHRGYWLSQVRLKQRYRRPCFEVASRLHWHGHDFPFPGQVE